MDKLTERLIDQLIEQLISSGKLNGHLEYKVIECRKALENGLATREGVPRLVDNICSQWRQIDNVAAYLYRSYGKLPYKKPPKSIEEEIAEEQEDIREALAMAKEIEVVCADGTPQVVFHEDASFLYEKPSVLDCLQYKGMEDLYAENLYIKVFREAKANHTSMHEICRRKGLYYDILIH